MSCVTLLPEEFSCPNEWCWVFELPPDNITPLVEQQGQVSVRSDPLCKGWVHDSLTGWSDGNWLVQVTLTTLSHPGNLCAKTLNVILFFVECLFSDKHGEVAVLDTDLLKFGVHELLNVLPNEE